LTAAFCIEKRGRREGQHKHNAIAFSLLLPPVQHFWRGRCLCSDPLCTVPTLELLLQPPGWFAAAFRGCGVWLCVRGAGSARAGTVSVALPPAWPCLGGLLGLLSCAELGGGGDLSAWQAWACVLRGSGSPRAAPLLRALRAGIGGGCLVSAFLCAASGRCVCTQGENRTWPNGFCSFLSWSLAAVTSSTEKARKRLEACQHSLCLSDALQRRLDTSVCGGRFVVLGDFFFFLPPPNVLMSAGVWMSILGSETHRAWGLRKARSLPPRGDPPCPHRAGLRSSVPAVLASSSSPGQRAMSAAEARCVVSVGVPEGRTGLAGGKAWRLAEPVQPPGAVSVVTCFVLLSRSAHPASGRSPHRAGENMKTGISAS